MQNHQGLTQQIIGVFYAVYNELGYGFLESVYEQALLFALEDAGLAVQHQKEIEVWFRGRRVGEYKADIVVENVIMLELKAVRELNDQHTAQLLNYLRATNIEIGLLLNFGPVPQIKRKAFENERKSCFQTIHDNL